jgi:hypothetical protein
MPWRARGTSKNEAYLAKKAILCEIFLLTNRAPEDVSERIRGTKKEKIFCALLNAIGLYRKKL